MADKEFKTIDEQIDILKSRGLSIPDESLARQFLMRNNYYRISGFSLTLRDHDKFYKNAEFQNIIDIYEFDYHLRHILLKYIEEIEVAFKSAYAYEFTSLYGPVGYLEAGNFTDEGRYKQVIEKAEQQKSARLPHEAYLKHFINDLKQSVPLWAYVDLLTISDMSILYSISEEQVKKAVSDDMGIKVSNTALLGRFMHSMTIIRNLCAHGSRIYNRLFEQKPSLNKKEKQLLIVDKNGDEDNAHLYGFILIMRRLLTKETFAEMRDDIIRLTQEYPFVDMRHYGFRSDWKNVL